MDKIYGKFIQEFLRISFQKFLLLLLLLYSTPCWASGPNFNDTTQKPIVSASTGNVGIGSTAPGQALDVTGTVRATAFSLGGSTITTWPGGGGSNYWLNNSGVGIGTYNNVGIGTTTPQGAFVVTNGNVGIGTWAPAYKLQVKGSMKSLDNTLDDGSGNMTIAGAMGISGNINETNASLDTSLNVNQGNSDSSWSVIGNPGVQGVGGGNYPLLTALNQNSGNLGIGAVGINNGTPSYILDIDATGAGGSQVADIGNSNGTLYIQDKNGGELALGNAGAEVRTTSNLLDDGSGKAFFQDILTPNLENPMSTLSIQDDSGDLILGNAASTVTTTNNTLDDGAGNMTVAGSFAVGAMNIDTDTYSNPDLGISNETNIVTSNPQLVLGQTGDNFGASYIYMQNHDGAQGAIFVDPSSLLTDFGFITSYGLANGNAYDINVRLEQRDGEHLLSANDIGNGGYGAMEFIQESSSTPYAELGPEGAEINTELTVTGKTTSSGGYDPPYVLLDPQTQSDIIDRMDYEVPAEKRSGLTLYWDGQHLNGITVDAQGNGSVYQIQMTKVGSFTMPNNYNTQSQKIYFWDGRSKSVKSMVIGMHDKSRKMPENMMIDSATGKLSPKPPKKSYHKGDGHLY